MAIIADQLLPIPLVGIFGNQFKREVAVAGENLPIPFLELLHNLGNQHFVVGAAAEFCPVDIATESFQHRDCPFDIGVARNLVPIHFAAVFD